jgi:hypothetical protein
MNPGSLERGRKVLAGVEKEVTSARHGQDTSHKDTDGLGLGQGVIAPFGEFGT